MVVRGGGGGGTGGGGEGEGLEGGWEGEDSCCCWWEILWGGGGDFGTSWYMCSPRLSVPQIVKIPETPGNTLVLELLLLFEATVWTGVFPSKSPSSSSLENTEPYLQEQLVVDLFYYSILRAAVEWTWYNSGPQHYFKLNRGFVSVRKKIDFDCVTAWSTEKRSRWKNHVVGDPCCTTWIPVCIYLTVYAYNYLCCHFCICRWLSFFLQRQSHLTVKREESHSVKKSLSYYPKHTHTHFFT